MPIAFLVHFYVLNVAPLLKDVFFPIRPLFSGGVLASYLEGTCSMLGGHSHYVRTVPTACLEGTAVCFHWSSHHVLGLSAMCS